MERTARPDTTPSLGSRRSGDGVAGTGPVAAAAVLLLLALPLAGCTDGGGSGGPVGSIEPRETFTWAPVGVVVPRDVRPGDLVGASVAWVGADRVAVGAPGTDAAGEDAGAVHVFAREGDGRWTLEATLTADDGDDRDRFGFRIAGDGDTLLVGAPADEAQGTTAGSAYVFVRAGGRWVERAKLAGSGVSVGHLFGRTLALYGDVAVVGAPGAGPPARPHGAAYVFERTGPGTWSETAKLEPDLLDAGDDYGSSVAVHGGTVVVGASNRQDVGAVYVYTRGGDGWTRRTELVPGAAAPGDSVGAAVALHEDVLLVGAPGDDDRGDAAGAVHVYVGSGASWSRKAKLTASDGAAKDGFGQALAVDGPTLVVGAQHDDHGGAINAGAAYVFAVRDGTWAEEAKLVAEEPGQDEKLGGAVDVAGTRVAAGAEDDGQGGAAHLFEGRAE